MLFIRLYLYEMFMMMYKNRFILKFVNHFHGNVFFYTRKVMKFVNFLRRMLHSVLLLFYEYLNNMKTVLFVFSI